MKKYVWSVSLLLMLSACNSSEEQIELNPSDAQTGSKLAAESMSEEELKAAAEERKKAREEREKERLATLTTMEVLPREHDFGVIPKEVPVSKTFTVKNTGDNPLTINDAKASCGCTVPKKPEEPIAPGETGELEVTFTSKPNQAGQTINKTVTITANVDGGTDKIIIKGKVQD